MRDARIQPMAVCHATLRPSWTRPPRISRPELTRRRATATHFSPQVRLSILIPAYYEQSTIGEVVRLVRHVDLESMGIEKEIIVCDDGSGDRTAAEVEHGAEGDPRVRLVRHVANRGKGAAIRTALAHATGDVCLIQD